MKIILTGSSGFIGKEVLKQCLQHPSITSVVALSRRQLPAHEKLEVALVEDFLSYSDSMSQLVEGADACIWTLGKARIPDNEKARRITLDYTLAGVRMMQTSCNKPFRFIYCSGAAAERDQAKPMWFLQDYRRIRGQVENELLKFSDEQPDFRSHILRPGMVITRERLNLRSLAFGLGPSVYIDVLASAMIKLALDGDETNTWDNAEIIRQGLKGPGLK